MHRARRRRMKRTRSGGSYLLPLVSGVLRRLFTIGCSCWLSSWASRAALSFAVLASRRSVAARVNSCETRLVVSALLSADSLFGRMASSEGMIAPLSAAKTRKAGKFPGLSKHLRIPAATRVDQGSRREIRLPEDCPRQICPSGDPEQLRS